jgi:nitrogen fixation/metabolism regulation signal transduction histidine kinase
MLLVAELANAPRTIVYANLAARQLLSSGRKLEGHALHEVLEQAAPALIEALGRGGDGLFTAGEGESEEVYHLARRQFSLNGRRHELLLLRQLTTELRRQEVQTWKKVIRVISHELNNSLAPLASLAHSGAELVRRGQTERLPQILETIGERTRHLESFILGYARFAKLPTPRIDAVRWDALIARLAGQVAFRVAGELPSGRPRSTPPRWSRPCSTSSRTPTNRAPGRTSWNCRSAACRRWSASTCWTAAAA